MKGKEVADADVSMRITHPATADLDIFLIAPNGATVGLANDNAGQAGNAGYGSGVAGCSGDMTTFSDETFNFLSPTATEVNEPGEILSPWAGTVEPQGLPAPLNIVDGGRARGTWTLRILDDTNGDSRHAELLQGPDQAPDAVSLEGRPLAGGPLLPQLPGSDPAAPEGHPVPGRESIGMIVIGIDPGAANTGFGVVRTINDRMVALDGGVIETAPDLPAEDRLAKIHESLGQLIEWHEPKALALEDLFFGKNVGSALAVGQARGVAMLAAAQRGVPCFDYTPQAVKKAVCGSGSADKGQVQANGRHAAGPARAADARPRRRRVRGRDLPRGRRRAAEPPMRRRPPRRRNHPRSRPGSARRVARA